jgi:transposase
MKDFLTEEQIKVLRFEHRHLRDKKLADRIKAILALNSGYSYEQISNMLLLDEVTLRRYVQKFQEQGISGLLECHYHGGKSQLSTLEQQALETYLVSHTLTTAKEISDHIQKTYGKKYSVLGVTKLLHRMGFTYKKPKIIPGNVSPVLQEEWIKRYESIKETLGKNDHIYFSDATHPTHNTKPSYGWIKKGKKNDVYIKSNTGRSRLNVLGAMNITNKIAVVIERKTIDALAIIDLCEEVKKKQPHGKVYMILDNAKYHHARIVNNWFLNHPRFKRIFLPAYSPNLNIIERLWRFFHQKVTNNHYFATFQEFKEVTMQFFQNLKEYKEELETLLTENFQTLPVLPI